MPLSQRWTLTRYLIEERRRYPQASGDLNALILDISIACKAIARIVSYGEIGDGLSAVPQPEGGAVNVQGEVQKPLDVLSNDIFIRMNEWSGHLAGKLASRQCILAPQAADRQQHQDVGAKELGQIGPRGEIVQLRIAGLAEGHELSSQFQHVVL